jgi:hypothetical protein
MLNPKTTIGEVIVLTGGSIKRQSEIFAHPGYGITCAELGTTNGNITEVSKRIQILCESVPSMRAELDDASYDIKVRINGRDIDASAVDEVAVFSILAELYASANQTVSACAS